MKQQKASSRNTFQNFLK